MSQILRKFVPRAPRYVLSPTDNGVMRVAPGYGRNTGSIVKSRLVNLSESGAALLMDEKNAPHLGEVIKVELPVPGKSDKGDQIAWWAEVVRVQFHDKMSWWVPEPDPFEDRQVLVALRFENLPDGHRYAIRAGLEDRFLEIVRERRHRQWLYLREGFLNHLKQIILISVCAAAIFTLLYWLHLPSPNYDPVKGSPWGQRFPLFNFDKVQTK